MIAYANPEDISNQRKRADGYGLVRFNKKLRHITFECWPRFSNSMDGDQAQFPGWPVTVAMQDNDGRIPSGWLPDLKIQGQTDPVVQVIDESNREVLYTLRIKGDSFQPPVFHEGTYTVRLGTDSPNAKTITGLRSQLRETAGELKVKLR